ncbi:histidinol-phosphatase, partial [Buchnera aphidicola]|nr:histidinol-phosphatase [Buchnera aphidicola]
MKQKILFIDRDGTLIHEPSDTFQIDSIQKILFKKYVISSLYKLTKLNYKLIMITNQDGLGTDSFPLKNFNIPNRFILDIFSSENIIFDDILICPHFLWENCNCRKPLSTMLKPWLIDDVIDRKHSYIIGDRDTDMILAKNINLTGIRYQDRNCTWKNIVKIILQRNRFGKVVRKT